MAKLINGDGNKAIYAGQDADLIASITGNASCVAAVGNEYGYTLEDASTIGLGDGVIITKEGRRIQLDAGQTDIFEIPTGTTGVTNYYIIGYHLYTEQDSSQVCETFVRKMADGTATITEDTFRGGASDVYVSVYRVKQVSMNIDTVTLLLPKLSNLTALNTALTDLTFTSDIDVALPNSWYSGSGGSIHFYRKGKVVEAVVNNLKAAYTGSDVTNLLNIPANFRPDKKIIWYLISPNTGGVNGRFELNTNGTVDAYFYGTAGDVNVSGSSITYFC